MFGSIKRMGMIEDPDTFIVNINQNVLNRSVISSTSEGVEKSLHTERYRAVTMPDFMESFISGVYGVDKKAPLKDLLTKAIIFDEVLATDLYNLFIQWEDMESVESCGLVSRASLSEFNKRQVLVGAPIKHVALPEGRHNIYESVPASFSEMDFSFIPDLAKQWLIRMNDGKKFKSKDFTGVKSPRLTSQGMLLKGPGETPKLRFIRKAVQAKLATKYDSHKQIDAFYERLDMLAKEFGYTFTFRSFITGIRRQQTSKPEPIQSREPNYPVNSVTAYSEALQGRVRGIFMPPELSKIFKKPPGEAVKKMMFKKHNVFKVAFDHVGTFLTKIAGRHYDMHGEEFEGTYLTYDLSQYDTTQHKGLYDIYQEMMNNLVEGYSDVYDNDFIAKHKLVTSSGVGRNSNLVEFDPAGFSKLSGEPEVTVSNNIIAYAVFLAAWSKVLGKSVLELDDILGYSDNPNMYAKIHGDDAGAFMSDDSDDYIKFKEEYEKSGLILDFEKVPAYLKKIDSSCYKDKSGQRLKSGTIYGIPGSILKNRFGEYPRSHPAVVVAGMIDTIDLIPEGTDYYDLYSDFAEVILSATTPYKTVKTAREYYKSKQFVDDIVAYAKSSIIKSQEVKSILDRHFYSNGEIFDNDNLAEIYGSLEYDMEDLNSLSLPDTVEDLEELILSEQRKLFESDGTGTVMEEYITDIED